MVRLSVNINKIATLRNSRGGNIPNVVEAAINCESYGAQGITVHPRPDERHIKRSDVMDLIKVVKTEFNIEGYPSDNFIELVKKVKPAQVTLVPDPPEALTSNQGWDTITNKAFLIEVIKEFHTDDIRTSIFTDTNLEMIENAALTGTDRIELYTEPYAANYSKDRESAVMPYVQAAQKAVELGLELNAGHDLNLDNLKFFKDKVPGLSEVSIGHALIADALYYGMEKTIQLYLKELK
ncbi:MAG: pyridoxine 5'-phosphate synthase [Bacteroidales bacterium]|nr:pyridoxine 5'-phosphate synthase [Bacteroidales bacterium]